eukprot:COSAG04_NODE_219_length_19842_cov_1164.283695_12_plen_106_part_00
MSERKLWHTQGLDSGKKEGTIPLHKAQARLVSGGDASSLLPRQFEVDTPEVTLIVKTLERDDATVRPRLLSLSPSSRPFVSFVRQRLLLESLHRLLALWSLAAGC